MNILCVYVDGGKGHYIPAKAVQEQLQLLGHSAELIDFFHLVKLKTIGKINKKVWRMLLSNPKFEQKFSRHNDQDSNGMKKGARFIKLFRLNYIKKLMVEKKVDLIFATHPYASYFLSYLIKKAGLDIPVCYFATDVFSAPYASISNNLTRYYISTQEGVDYVKKLGQDPSTIVLAPFPLQASCKNNVFTTKEAAREKLGLEPNLFTLQINFGGEGIGTTSLLQEIAKLDIPMQIVILGKIEEHMMEKLESITKDFPSHIKVKIPGFVNNVNDYLNATDIIAGRAGINTLVEAFYLRRPFLITELVYTVIPSADYVEKYKVGWNANLDIQKQISIIKEYASNPSKLDELDKNFDKIPIVYDARALAEMLLKEIKKPN